MARQANAFDDESQIRFKWSRIILTNGDVLVVRTKGRRWQATRLGSGGLPLVHPLSEGLGLGRRLVPATWLKVFGDQLDYGGSYGLGRGQTAFMLPSCESLDVGKVHLRRSSDERLHIGVDDPGIDRDGQEGMLLMLFFRSQSSDEAFHASLARTVQRPACVSFICGSRGDIDNQLAAWRLAEVSYDLRDDQDR